MTTAPTFHQPSPDRVPVSSTPSSASRLPCLFLSRASVRLLELTAPPAQTDRASSAAYQEGNQASPSRRTKLLPSVPPTYLTTRPSCVLPAPHPNSSSPRTGRRVSM
ncbi:uncharacterized protein BKA78DRAFT_296149 [Phyllosticta capitalensis]|uniref:uncharacterized protein n=1 Tax=Phyllosticta capitalensis TaxID=121624 RepID=UPI00312E0A33